MSTAGQVVVVGASSAGLFSAYLLARQGLPVTVYDQAEPGSLPPRTLIVTPDLTRVFAVLNKFFNMAAYNPNGREAPDADAREEGYLFWLAWVAQNSTSIFSTGDAQGNFRRFTASASCSTIRGLVQDEPALELLLGVTSLLNDPGLCPTS